MPATVCPPFVLYGEITGGAEQTHMAFPPTMGAGQPPTTMGGGGGAAGGGNPFAQKPKGKPSSKKAAGKKAGKNPFARKATGKR